MASLNKELAADRCFQKNLAGWPLVKWGNHGKDPQWFEKLPLLESKLDLSPEEKEERYQNPDFWVASGKVERFASQRTPFAIIGEVEVEGELLTLCTNINRDSWSVHRMAAKEWFLDSKLFSSF